MTLCKKVQTMHGVKVRIMLSLCHILEVKEFVSKIQTEYDAKTSEIIAEIKADVTMNYKNGKRAVRKDGILVIYVWTHIVKYLGQI